ncbi:hypothetical protein Scep_000140 [Stephania cephalantha]|uniref:Uncharacterized protein n=1 Tax=Stephania cephalantha TaxID=152367 RepID=A0AAP0Q3V1_9MAGN
MSKFGSPSDRKPPLYQSRYQLRSRRVLQPEASPFQTPQASLTKIPLPSRLPILEKTEIRPEYQSISCELQALAKMVKDEFGNNDMGNAGFVDTFNGNLFERGRFYDEYSARRNERLKRKKCQKGDKEEEKRSSYSLGVNCDSVKRRDLNKLGSLRKTAPESFMTASTVNVRYSLRSNSKENKKPPLLNSIDRSATVKIGARKGRRI